MNLKLRFALLFTGFVALILLASSITIYALYQNYREADFYLRLKTRCSALLTDYRDLRGDKKNAILNRFRLRGMHKEDIVLIKPSMEIIYRETDTVNINISTKLLSNIKREKELHYKQDDLECLGLYFDDLDIYVVAGAVDKVGFRKLSNLFYILSGVFGGGLFLTALFSFFFVQQAFKPLVKLSQQMQLTTASNMAVRVEEGEGKDEIHQIAKHFNAMLERLHKGFENRKSFVQHASHELRTPLATMLSITESALNSECTIEEYRDILQSLQEEQNGLIELTNALLLLSQYDNFSPLENWSVIRIDELLYDSIAAGRKQFEGLEIDVSFEITPKSEEELLIKGDEILLKSVFKNLIKNAYLYANDKHLSISISPKQEKLEVSFLNFGTQLSNDDVNKMFVPFFRGSNIAESKGFGLGLSIVNRILSMHHSSLSYQRIGTNINKFSIVFSSKAEIV